MRNYNKSLPVGANTYPYINGVIWEPLNPFDNTVTIATNRPGGVSVNNTRHDRLDFFLTRKINNVNMNKGLPNKLDD